jgi:hypothetical protein
MDNNNSKNKHRKLLHIDKRVIILKIMNIIQLKHKTILINTNLIIVHKNKKNNILMETKEY